MSRLRNRIRKADYFTDGELLRWPRDKRTTYSGLWALAEDSGCLEDDPFEWKMSLWPSPLDADITIEMLEQWRNELIEAGKLVPYEADGKRYLFLRNFHAHEKPTNPQQPDLPLPPWVCIDSKQGQSKDGKRWARCTYTVSADLLPQRPGISTDSAQSQSRPEITDSEVPCSVLLCTALNGTEPISTDADPVDNSAKPERGCSIEHEEHDPEPPGSANGDGAAASHAATGDNVGTLRHSPTCEDRECAVRTLRCGLRGTIAQIVGPAEAGNLYNESTALHKSLAGMAGYICAATWKASNAATMEQRHPLCRKAMVAYVEALYDFHRQKPIRSLPAFLKTRYGNMTEAPVSDELLAALRKLERTGTNGKSEPVRVGTTLPPIERVEKEAS